MRRLVVVLTCLFACARLFLLETSPPGFYVDEAAIAAQVQCVQTTGRDWQGRSMPLFSEVLGGGYVTPSYLYPAVVWTSVFGDSIASHRSLSAAAGVALILLIGLLAWQFTRDPNVAVAAAFFASISPWGWTMSRLAWDPALAPTYWILALVLLFHARGRSAVWALGGGVATAFAAMSYPPLRVQIILSLPILFWIWLPDDRKSALRKAAVAAGAAAVVASPLLLKTWTGELQGRFNMLAIWNPWYREQQGLSNAFLVFWEFLKNMGAHLNPSYLWFQGDSNLRHSSQAVGEWGWLASLALLGLVGAARSREQRKWVFALSGLFVAGLVPAALTWESVPHALRSFGAFPFLPILAGLGLCEFVRNGARRWLAIALLGVATFGWFLNDYFREYPRRAEIWFDVAIAREGLRDVPNVRERIRAIDSQYADLAISYYESRRGEGRCPSR